MYRGGSRWSIAIGVVSVIALVMPAAVLASTPVTLTLSASSSSQFTDVPLTFTVTADPAVAGIQLQLDDNGSPLAQGFGVTDSDGVGTITLTAPLAPVGPQLFTASSTGDGIYEAATSNAVEVVLNRHPVSISLWAESDRGSPFVTYLDPFSIVVDIPMAVCDGSLEIKQLPSGIDVQPGGQPWVRNGVVVCEWFVNMPVQPLGALTFQADYSHSFVHADASTGPVTINVTLIPTTTAVELSTRETEAGTTVALSALVSAPVHGDLVYNTGTVTFFDGSTPLGTVPLGSEGTYGFGGLFEPFDTLGTHAITAVWSGTDIGLSSTSPPVDLSVVKDFAHAVDLGVSYATFYPVVDGFDDTVSIRGELDEQESAAITISSVATGAVVRRFLIPMRDVGDYSVAWNGRKAMGTAIVPAGAYRITTVITDNLGATITFTDKVTVSLKKLVWHTGTTVLYGNHFKARGESAGKITASPAYSGGVRLTLPFAMVDEYAAVGYQFSLPSATRYSGLSFNVLGSGSEVVWIGLQDKRLGVFPSGSTWVAEDFGPLKQVSSRYGWTSATGNLTYNLLGHTVRAMVISRYGGYYDVAKVELRFRYALLK